MSRQFAVSPPARRPAPPPALRRAGRLLAALLLAALPLAGPSVAAQEAPPFGVQVGQRAPLFTMVDASGEPVGNRDALGTPLLLNFWATWCGPCRAEMPLFARAAADLDGELDVLLVNLSEPPERIDAFLDELGVALPVARDATDEERRALVAAGVDDAALLPSAAVFNVYRAFGLPTTYFIDADGVIRAVKAGPVGEAELGALLARVGVDWQPRSP